MASDDEIFDVLCRLIEPLNKGKVPLDRQMDIAADLNIDSVSVMGLVMEIEDEFDIEVPLNVLGESRTLNDLVVVIKGLAAKS